MEMNIKKIMLLIMPILFWGLLSYFNEVKAADNKKTIDNGTYVIKSAINEKYVIDISNALKTDGANVQTWSNASVNQQKFKVEYISNGYYKITSVNSNKVLDVAGGLKTAGTNVQQFESNNTDAQKWLIKDAGNGYYYIVSKCNGLYVDVANGVAKDGSNLQMYTGNSTKAQKFKFEAVKTTTTTATTTTTVTGTKTISDGTYTIMSAVNENFVLDIASASKNDGANLYIWKNESVARQRFKVKYLNDGYYTITAEHSSKVLDVANGGKTAGTNVQQYTSNNSDAQKWVIKDAGNGYYYIISKCNGLYMDVANGTAKNGSNIQVYTGNKTNAQKFKFKEYSNPKTTETTTITGTKTVADGTYTIKSAINNNYVLDVSSASKSNGANIQIWTNSSVAQQRFKVKYIDNGYYTITAEHSNKVLDVANGGKTAGTNVQQYTSNNSDAQKWVIKDAGNGYYYIISKANNLYIDVNNGTAKNGSNIQVYTGNKTNAQKFKFEKYVESTTSTAQTITLDTTKYPGYKEKLQALAKAHPNWTFKFLYTEVKFSDAVSGEYSVRKRNLVPTSYSGEWICGTTLYDTGWYGASEKAIAYYMDPRNFLDETNIFQFQDVNQYISGACTLDGIKSKVSNTYLSGYEEDINNACLNTNVNPYYIIARLIQEQGTKGGSTVKMKDGNKYYYNPFNIGATGDSTSEVIANALARAKKENWDTMQKALEGGIYFCKINWLENYQNTLYQNRFDIDKTNGTSLYTHQYMQNLMGAYNEARTLYGMYKNTNKVDSKFTFIIPLYENMDKTLSPMPSNTTESYPINVKTTGTNINVRSDANTNSSVVKTIANKGTVLLSVQRGVNSSWNKVVLSDGTIGYISGTYLAQVDDVKTCNYKAKVKTNDGDGCKVRVGPSLKLDMISVLADGVQVTVMDDSTYKNIDGYDWSRVMLSNGVQGFMPTKFLTK